MDKKLGIVGLFALLFIGLMAVSVVAVPVTVDWLKIDGDKVEDGDLLDVERNSGIDIKIQFKPDADVEDMYVEALVSGYEYGILRDDSVTIRDLEAGKTYKTSMHIDLPQNMDKDEYTLRVLMHDRNGVLSNWEFDLDIGVPRHAMLIKDVIFEPENSVKTGRSLIANARIKNIGEKDEGGIKVIMSIPELGVSDSEYIDELESEDSVTSEAMHIRISDCVTPGEYDVIVTATFDEGEGTATFKSSIVVVDGDVCKVGGESVITIGPKSQEIARGTGASYPVTIENSGSAAKEYTVSIKGASDFAVAQVTPSATVTVQPGDSETVYAYVVVDKDAPLGEHVVTINVESGDEIVQSAAVKATVTKAKDSSGLVTALEIGLIVLIVLLIILAIIVGVSKMRNNDDDDEDDEEAGQTYY